MSRARFLTWLVLSHAPFGRSQTQPRSQAKCVGEEFNWMFNSLSQSPCTVAAYLGQPCNATGDYVVPALNSTSHYNLTRHHSPCECTSVMYSLFSACALCQTAQVNSWSDYSKPCQSDFESDGQYSFQIPSGTKVPAWAFLPVEASSFNLTAAQLKGNTPEVPQPVSTTSSIAPTSPTSSPSSAPSPQSAPIGAIVGGSIGGILFLLIITVASTVIFLRKRRMKQYRANTEKNYNESIYSAYMSNGSQSVRRERIGRRDHQRSPSFGKLYDPNDPSTFPPAMGSTTPLPYASPVSSMYSSESAPMMIWTPFVPPDAQQPPQPEGSPPPQQQTYAFL